VKRNQLVQHTFRSCVYTIR